MQSKTQIVIIDYGMGNIRSILNKIHSTGYEASVSDDISVLRAADKLILPGVGHFQIGMKNLFEKNLIEILNEKVLVNKTPILGICLGMQIFTHYSEEGNTMGLKWIDAKTIKFRLNNIRFKVPHMGWNSIEQKKESPLLSGVPENSYFYFVHSYHIDCRNNEDILTTSNYGYDFVSSIQRQNIFGTQFHPEKSHSLGEKILNNFLDL